MNDDAIRELARDLVDKLTDSYYKSPESFELAVDSVLKVFGDAHDILHKQFLDTLVRTDHNFHTPDEVFK